MGKCGERIGKRCAVRYSAAFAHHPPRFLAALPPPPTNQSPIIPSDNQPHHSHKPQQTLPFTLNLAQRRNSYPSLCPLFTISLNDSGLRTKFKCSWRMPALESGERQHPKIWKKREEIASFARHRRQNRLSHTQDPQFSYNVKPTITIKSYNYVLQWINQLHSYIVEEQRKWGEPRFVILHLLYCYKQHHNAYWQMKKTHKK